MQTNIDLCNITSLEQLEQELISRHDDSYGENCPGQMVIQIWKDGEITAQKGEDLLWQRSLHCFDGGVGENIFQKFTSQSSCTGNNRFVYYPGDNYMEIGNKIRELYNKGG